MSIICDGAWRKQKSTCTCLQICKFQWIIENNHTKYLSSFLGNLCILNPFFFELVQLTAAHHAILCADPFCLVATSLTGWEFCRYRSKPEIIKSISASCNCTQVCWLLLLIVSRQFDDNLFTRIRSFHRQINGTDNLSPWKQTFPRLHKRDGKMLKYSWIYIWL